MCYAANNWIAYCSMLLYLFMLAIDDESRSEMSVFSRYVFVNFSISGNEIWRFWNMVLKEVEA